MLWQLAEYLLQVMGFDFNRGAFSTAEHPFTTEPGKDDVRVTTHYYPTAFYSSMFSITHEGGHAFQAFLSSGIKIPEYQNPTLESCEIHSMSMEFFAWPYCEGFFGEDADKYRYHHLCDAIEFLPYGATIDEFQHWVYDNPNATHEERCAFFRSLELKYTPHKVYDDTPAYGSGRYWLRQSHVFSTPFYYIDYTLAQVCAFQFAVEMNKNHEKTWKKYVKLCKCGGKYPFLTLLEKNHIRNPFEAGNIKKVIKPLEKILKNIDTSSF